MYNAIALALASTEFGRGAAKAELTTARIERALFSWWVCP